MADEKEKKKSYSVSKLYETSGESVTRKNPNCPKCGDGFRMALHEKRRTCGKCQYTEF